MDELKRILDAAIDDHAVDGILKALADVLHERAAQCRNIDAKPQWIKTAMVIDRARLDIEV